MMVRADQHRLVQKLLTNKGYQEAGYWHRGLGRVSELLMATGQWMQTRYPIDTTINRVAGGKTSKGLATATAVSLLSNQSVRAIVTARGSHSAAPLLTSPSKKHNLLDLHLAALC